MIALLTVVLDVPDGTEIRRLPAKPLDRLTSICVLKLFGILEMDKEEQASKPGLHRER